MNQEIEKNSSPAHKVFTIGSCTQYSGNFGKLFVSKNMWCFLKIH